MSMVCVFFATGFEEVEALTVVDLLRRAGIETKMVSITGERVVTSSHRVSVLTDSLLEEITFSDVDMIVLPGGMPGTKNLEACELLMKQVTEFHKEKRYISAICAAPRILAHLGILKGEKACCYPDYETELADGGAQVVRKNCQISSNIITSRGMGTALDFALAIVERFKGKQAADMLADAIVYENRGNGV